MALEDWGEAIVAANLVFEPLFGELVRVEMFSRFAPRNGDAVTPAVLGTAENDWQRNLRWTRELVGILLRDPEHGAGNKRVIEGWVAKWLPRTREAMEDFAPVFELPAVRPRSFGEARRRVEGDCAALLGELGLDVGGLTGAAAAAGGSGRP
jgi:hypothetical protein